MMADCRHRIVRQPGHWRRDIWESAEVIDADYVAQKEARRKQLLERPLYSWEYNTEAFAEVSVSDG